MALERGGIAETYNVGGRDERTNLHVVESSAFYSMTCIETLSRSLLTVPVTIAGTRSMPRCFYRILVGGPKRVSKLASKRQFAGTLKEKSGGRQF